MDKYINLTLCTGIRSISTLRLFFIERLVISSCVEHRAVHIVRLMLISSLLYVLHLFKYFIEQELHELEVTNDA